MPELFVEIGTEEIPAGYVEPAFQFLQRELAAFFSKNRLKADFTCAFGTPRRLVAAFTNVDMRQEDVVETYYGPGIDAAYDAQGNPTKAALGFARGKGVDVAALTREKTPKGEVICARAQKKGEATSAILNAFLPRLIAEIPFPKKMRWGAKALAFARPIHWVVALFDGKTLDFEVDGLRCGNASRGHRFLKPDAFNVDDLKSYLRQCETHFVVVDPEIRKRIIDEQAQALARATGGRVENDPKLTREVAYLVEYPVALRCDFEAKYLELPKELLAITMKRHQRYFPVSDADGKLMPHFIAIANMKPGAGNEIKRGNERVLRARLEDARFFYNEDRKKKLEEFVEPLKGVVFQKSLGTSYEKMTRFSALAKEIAAKVCPCEAEKIQRAAWLCKADLVTPMVFEFPELQGIIGGYYALHSGEDPEVARAIQEHYRPAFAGDAPPSSPIGAVVAVADKMDTIVGCIGVGLIPSGSEDPYGLRRHSLGIIQIVLDRGWQVSLNEWIDTAVRLLGAKTKLKPEEIRSHVTDLFALRFKSLLDSEGFAYDVIDAVLSTGIDSFIDVKKKVAAFADLKKQPYFEPLAIAFRRVVSILTPDAEGSVKPELLKEGEEKQLFEHYLKIREPAQKLVDEKNFAAALEKIVEIKPSVDRFFDKVMVMVEDVEVRKNRLRLLFNISRLFSRIADFSRIVLKKS